MSSFTLIEPATGKAFATYPMMQQKEVSDIIEQMRKVQVSWSQSPVSLRKQCFLKLAESLLTHKPKVAKLITTEMGKPMTQALGEVEKSAKLCRYYAEAGEQFLEDELIETEYAKSYRSFQPLGIIFAIMPWNFPLWQVLRFAVPNLMAGNAGLLKHAPNTLGVALAIENLFLEAGFPKDLFRSLVVDLDQVPFIIHYPGVAGVTLTGSNRAGKSVAKEAGAALKKLVLELGGSDPYLILEDADLSLAAEDCVRSRLSNAGQVCIAAKRIIVVEKVRAAFEALVLKQAQGYQCGDPLQESTKLGPMARADLRLQVQKQVDQAIKEGARCLLGGKIPTGPGFYYPATLLTDVKADSLAFREEIFGPVICLISARDEEHAIELANDTPFGLAAGVYTRNLAKGEHIAKERLQVGTAAVNSIVTSDPRLPFGGIKQSGYGRELSLEGMREFVNIKTVTVSA